MTARMSGWDAEELTEAILKHTFNFPYVDTAFPRNNNRLNGGNIEEDHRVDFLQRFDHIALPGDGRTFLIQTKTNPRDAMKWRERIENNAQTNAFGAGPHLVIECWLYRRERPGYDTWRWTGTQWTMHNPHPEHDITHTPNPQQRLHRADTSLG